ncbi:fibronectin type III domain-containing protein [Patescibacteria group bacterium]
MRKLVRNKIILMLFAFSLLSVTAYADDPIVADVEILNATPLDSAITLTWDEPAVSDGITGYEIHYGLNSVSESGETYDNSVDAGFVTEYTLEGLENGTTYYFSVIAYDDATPTRNESEAWAPEASATPSGDGGGDTDDGDSPQVTEAEAIDSEHVKVVFSEAIVLPGTDPEVAFGIENEDTLETLEIYDAILDPDDSTEKTAILTTDVQELDATYRLTAGIDVQDKSGNSIISGTSDIAVFLGSDLAPALQDTDAPQLVSVEVVDSEHLLLTFNETIVLGLDVPLHFQIMAEDDATEILEVSEATMGADSEGNDDAVALITTDPQQDKSYIIIISGITDEAGNEIDPADGSDIFIGIASGEPADDDDDDDDAADDDDDDDDDDGSIFAAEDVANFLASKVFDAGKYVVKLSWALPDGQAGNILEQIIYMSEDKGSNYTKRATLDPDVTEYEIKNLDAGEYWFKITQKDDVGNETEGVITKLVLPATGPGMAGILIGTLVLGRVMSRRRKK